MVHALYCIASILFIWVLLNSKFDVVVSAFLLSYGASNCLFYIAAIPVSLIFAPSLGIGFSDDAVIDFNNPIYLLFYTLIAALQFFMAYRFFKLRRFRQGFPFLFKRFTVVIAMIVAGVVLVIVTMITDQRESYGTYSIVLPLVAAAVIIGAGIAMGIRRAIKMFQRRWAKEDNEKLLERQVAELKEQLRQSEAANETIRAANHSINHRLATVERGYAGLLAMAQKHAVSAEFGEDLTAALEHVRKLSRGYQENVNHTKAGVMLPSTNIRAVDDLFGLFAERFAGENILFKLNISGSIIHMTEHVIPESRLETMIGDHLQDALIAVNVSENSLRSVLVMLGEAGDCYEFTVHDSGVPFAPNTLMRLGSERVTTHAERGGSGLGFTTSFETMRACGASLIIKENRGGVFSKSITLRFDGQNRYIIETYRPSAFPESDRYAVIGCGEQ